MLLKNQDYETIAYFSERQRITCGESNPKSSLFSYIDLEARIPASHPMRKVRQIVDRELAG
jgi:hypothetical protein